MNKPKRFYNFIAEQNNQKLYVYGEIISGSEKWDETEVVFDDFRDAVEAMSEGSTLDIYINSPGGSVFATSGIVALLRRAKERGVVINATIDGLAASCASWLPMVANKIYAYSQSIMMIHSPFTFVVGNAKEMEREIAVLNKIQNDVMIPLYMEKAKEGVTAERIQELMEAETWLNASEMAELFDIEILEEERDVRMCATKEILNKFKNTPVEILNKVESEGEGEEPEQEPSEPQEPENEVVKELENKLKEALKENEELKNLLSEANGQISSLTDKVNELQPIVDKYNEEIANKEAEEKARLLNEKKEYYKNKFEKFGAKKKYESKEVQDLLDSVLDEKSEFELNKMLVNIMEENVTEKSTVVGLFNKSTMDGHMNNLLPTSEDVRSKYGFI